MGDGLRLSTEVKFASIEAPPNYRHIRRLIADVDRSLPGLGETLEHEWIKTGRCSAVLGPP
ncbi:MAG: hypothetical protein QF726_02445 [Alphaproteobacteria bacterium]|jgi:hypothetical protein|nr:hypothetical protein [Alphaproteobacteria bacterium]